jgi:hypothetical protein
MTSKFEQYLAESTKTYPFKIGVAGDLPEGFADTLETALQKFVVVKMSNGKKTPIQKRPLDFPALENERTTYFETELQYPTTPQVLQSYIKTYTDLPESHIIVRNPNEPQEEYQAEKSDAPYEAKLNSAYEDSKDEQKTVGSSRVMELLKELEKARKDRTAPDAAGDIKAPKDGGATENADDSKNKMSPISGKSKGK